MVFLDTQDGVGCKPVQFVSERNAKIERAAWVFIVEGILTIVVALAAFVFMTPSIEKSWWLKPEEKVALRAVMNASSRAGEEHGVFSWKESVISAFISQVSRLTIH